MLQVAARLLPAQLGLLLGRVQPALGLSARLGAGGDAAGGGVPHPRQGERLGPGSGSDGSAESTIPAAQEARPHSSVPLRGAVPGWPKSLAAVVQSVCAGVCWLRYGRHGGEGRILRPAQMSAVDWIPEPAGSAQLLPGGGGAAGVGGSDGWAGSWIFYIY